MRYRAIVEADLEAVVNIQERITRAPVTDRWRKMLAVHVGHDNQPAFVAEDGGVVLGFIMGEIKVGGFGFELTGWIDMIGVLPKHMGSGIGRNLAKRAMAHFAEQGVEDICTSVAWDSGDMLAFFKSMGFDRSPFINLKLGS